MATLSAPGSFGRPKPQASSPPATQDEAPVEQAPGQAQPDTDAAEPVGEYNAFEEAAEPPEIQYLEELLGVEIPEHLWANVASVLKSGKVPVGKAVEITKVRQEAVPAAKSFFKGFRDGTSGDAMGIKDLPGIK